MDNSNSKKKWCRCPKCKHKLFLYEPDDIVFSAINIKCSSCKSIVDVVLSNQDGVNASVDLENKKES